MSNATTTKTDTKQIIVDEDHTSLGEAVKAILLARAARFGMHDTTQVIVCN